MSSKKINVLIYSGPSTSLPSVRHATWTLRRLLGPHYAVHTLTADQLLKEPWPSTCALLVFPGGADMGYCRTLNGAGNRRIKAYVQGGGKYLGFCAGGYYGSAKCEFEVGRKGWEVVGARELAFYPGVCRGLAFPGFVYGSEKGARAVRVSTANGSFNSYYNGGGVFVDAERFADRGVEVLARFDEELAVDSGATKAAVVYCKVGDGAAVLTGPHPEFAGMNLNRNEAANPDYGKIVDALLATDEQRTDFLKTGLIRLGLQVSQEVQPVPSLSPLHLNSSDPTEISELLASWVASGLITDENGHGVIRGENDTFSLKHNDIFGTTPSVDDAPEGGSSVEGTMKKLSITSSSSSSSPESNDASPQTDGATDRIPDYNSLPKTLIAHTESHPSIKESPYFKHAEYYHWLEKYHRSNGSSISGDFGRVLLYGEVVTSTQTLLEKNPSLLSQLPIGTTAVATTQVSGRGRGTNVWVSPPGSMMFSTTFKHPMALSTTAPVVFVQYLAAMAIVTAIQNTYSSSSSPHSSSSSPYKNLNIRLKWPNDIYALDPSTTTNPTNNNNNNHPPNAYTKIGGILVNSSYSGSDYTLVLGIGLNLSHTHPTPTTSLNQLLTSSTSTSTSQQQHNEQILFTYERLLACILPTFETLYARFCQTGWDTSFEKMYYKMWLHSEQIVTLETTEEGGAGAVTVRIEGITRDWGLLVAEEVVGGGGQENGNGKVRGTGKKFLLQSDSNSFDFMRGLVRRKI